MALFVLRHFSVQIQQFDNFLKVKCAAAGHQYIVMDLPLLFEAGVIIAYIIIMITKLAYLIITIILT